MIKYDRVEHKLSQRSTLMSGIVKEILDALEHLCYGINLLASEHRRRNSGSVKKTTNIVNTKYTYRKG